MEGSGAKGEQFEQLVSMLGTICEQTYVQFQNAATGAFLLPPGFKLKTALQGRVAGGIREPFGFVLESAEYSVIAFRGTVSALDWITDAIARQVDYRFVQGGGRTHQGITDIYTSLRTRLFAAAWSLPKDKPLYVTGHSLGGALAVLAAPDLAANAGIVPAVYTFGAPRVGDWRFRLLFNKLVPEAYRWQNAHDLVTHVPPILYRSPLTKRWYLYLHVKGRQKLSYKLDSVSANHALANYMLKITGVPL
jgi:triacylglycerol lipase